MMKLAWMMVCVAGMLPAQKLLPLDQAAFAKMVATHKGKVVLVDFWATWCVPCRVEMPQLVKLSEKLRAKGLDFVTVSADEAGQEPGGAQVRDGKTVPAPLSAEKH